MKIFNPTHELIKAVDHGINYWIPEQKFITVADSIGNRILSKWEKYGAARIDIPVNSEPKQRNVLLLKSIYQALENRIEHLNKAYEGYLTFETELKQNNQNSTILKSKNVKKLSSKIKMALSSFEEFKKKHNLNLEKQENEIKSEELLASVDNMIKEMEADSENEQKAVAYEKDVNDILDQIMNPEDGPRVSKEMPIIPSLDNKGPKITVGSESNA